VILMLYPPEPGTQLMLRRSSCKMDKNTWTL
jgi:hypothetical protein